MKRIAVLLLCLAMLAAAACGKAPEVGSEPETANTSDESGSGEQFETGDPVDESSGEDRFDESELNMPWSNVFADWRWKQDDIPKGYVTPDEVSYLYINAEGGIEIENVPFEEVRAFSEAGKGVPRTHFFDDSFSQAYKEYVLPALDYGMAHGSLNFGFATEGYGISELNSGECKEILSEIVPADCRCDVTLVDFYRKNGRKLNYWRFSDERYRTDPQWAKDFKKAVDRANDIVGQLEGRRMNDYQKALWLYSYVVANVGFYPEDDYYDNYYNFLYDSLVNKSAVCTGYATAIYYLFNLAGIDCVYVSYSDGSFGHAWNAAKIDGDYYIFDATNEPGKDYTEFALFGISNGRIIDIYPGAMGDFYKEAFEELEGYPVCEKELSDKYDIIDNGIVW